MDVSPLPPIERGSPTTCRVSWAMDSMSAGVIPTSAVVTYRPPRLSRQRPNARSSASDLSVRGSPQMRAFPPPRDRPATADL